MPTHIVNKFYLTRNLNLKNSVMDFSLPIRLRIVLTIEYSCPLNNIHTMCHNIIIIVRYYSILM